MDTTSLIVKIQSSGLSVNTKPLESVLLSISQTLKLHDDVVSKLPKVEQNQSDLRKELHKLRMSLESIRAREDDDEDVGAADLANAATGCAPTATATTELKLGSAAAQNDSGNAMFTYGIRLDDSKPLQQKHANELSNAHDQAITKSLREIKSSIRRLQQDRDLNYVNSLELDEGIKALKDTLFEVQQKLSSSASIDQMQVLHQSLHDKYGQIELHLQEFKSSFHDEIEGKVSQNLSEVKSLFNDLETMVAKRQANLEQRVASCAREYDVAEFRESIESEVNSLMQKASFLDDTARAQGKTLVMLQQKNAIAMLHRSYTNWKQNALMNGLSRWKEVVKQQVEYEEGKESQKRLVRKILTNIMSRRKRFGFERWIRYRDWHRKTERLKLKASSLICEQFAIYLSIPKTKAFNKWRQLTLLDKMKNIRESEVEAEAEDTVQNETGDPTSSAPYVTTSQRKPTLCLNSILDSFKGDIHGATYALAAEIESIKSHDIASLREDWHNENQRLMSNIRTTMDEVIHKVEDTSEMFQETVNERVDSCANDLPILQSNVQALSEHFDSSRAEFKSMEESHVKKIETLFDQDQQMETRLDSVEGQAETSACEIASLFEQQAKSNDSIQQLRDTIAENEARREEERTMFQNALNHFGDELLKTKVTLGHTKVRVETLEKELKETAAELIHTQDTCQFEHNMVQRQIHHPGIPQPRLDRIINVGHAYETLAKEKSYVLGINVIATLRITMKDKMKRSGESTRVEEEVDLPSEIVAFAHDYAAWVAYQSDHESLMRLVAGTNPDEQVYAEDDLMSRRKDLCAELKKELGTLLEKASSYSTVLDKSGKKDPSSSTRGMGLRWEARAIFLARVADATEAALSKHDQILLPASTRLGKLSARPLSANVTVCVACDRPMRRSKLPSTADGSRTNSSNSSKAAREKIPEPECKPSVWM